MKGKDKCKILKEIRAQIAAANDIAWVTEECPHKGDCRGTCPKCEAEVAALERELARRRALGKTIAVVGLSAGIITNTVACAELSSIGNSSTLDGDLAVNTTTAPTTTWALTGDVDLGGAPLPPETEPGYELGGEPAPVYYLSDFTLYESETMYVITKDLYIDFITEDEMNPIYGCESLYAGDFFMLVGDNATEQREAWLYLVRYKGELYAMESNYLKDHSTVYVSENPAK